jgi:hypothetical protein
LSKCIGRKDKEGHRKESTLRVSRTKKSKLQHDNQKNRAEYQFFEQNLAMSKSNDDRSFISGEKG